MDTVGIFLPTGELLMTNGGGTQSSCQSDGYRMGFVEFLIPAAPGGIRRATLVLEETRGTISDSWPPATHDLSYYEADLNVDLGVFGLNAPHLEIQRGREDRP